MSSAIMILQHQPVATSAFVNPRFDGSRGSRGNPCFLTVTTTSSSPLESFEVATLKRAEGNQDAHSHIQHLKFSSTYECTPRKIVVLGGPASGKGTISSYLASKHDLLYVSVDELCQEGDSEDLVIKALKDRLQLSDALEKGYVLDGFPKSAAQARALFENGFVPELVLSLKVPDSVMIKRGSDVDSLHDRISKYHQSKSEISCVLSEFIVEIDASGGKEDVVRLVDELTNGVAF